MNVSRDRIELSGSPIGPGTSGTKRTISGINLILRGIDATNYLIHLIGDHINLIRNHIILIA